MVTKHIIKRALSPEMRKILEKKGNKLSKLTKKQAEKYLKEISSKVKIPKGAKLKQKTEKVKIERRLARQRDYNETPTDIQKISKHGKRYKVRTYPLDGEQKAKVLKDIDDYLEEHRPIEFVEDSKAIDSLRDIDDARIAEYEDLLEDRVDNAKKQAIKLESKRRWKQRKADNPDVVIPDEYKKPTSMSDWQEAEKYKKYLSEKRKYDYGGRKDYKNMARELIDAYEDSPESVDVLVRSMDEQLPDTQKEAIANMLFSKTIRQPYASGEAKTFLIETNPLYSEELTRNPTLRKWHGSHLAEGGVASVAANDDDLLKRMRDRIDREKDLMLGYERSPMERADIMEEIFKLSNIQGKEQAEAAKRLFKMKRADLLSEYGARFAKNQPDLQELVERIVLQKDDKAIPVLQKLLSESYPGFKVEKNQPLFSALGEYLAARNLKRQHKPTMKSADTSFKNLEARAVDKGIAGVPTHILSKRDLEKARLSNRLETARTTTPTSWKDTKMVRDKKTGDLVEVDKTGFEDMDEPFRSSYKSKFTGEVFSTHNSETRKQLEREMNHLSMELDWMESMGLEGTPEYNELDSVLTELKREWGKQKQNEHGRNIGISARELIGRDADEADGWEDYFLGNDEMNRAYQELEDEMKLLGMRFADGDEGIEYSPEYLKDRLNDIKSSTEKYFEGLRGRGAKIDTKNVSVRPRRSQAQQKAFDELMPDPRTMDWDNEDNVHRYLRNTDDEDFATLTLDDKLRAFAEGDSELRNRVRSTRDIKPQMPELSLQEAVDMISSPEGARYLRDNPELLEEVMALLQEGIQLSD